MLFGSSIVGYALGEASLIVFVVSVIACFYGRRHSRRSKSIGGATSTLSGEACRQPETSRISDTGVLEHLRAYSRKEEQINDDTPTDIPIGVTNALWRDRSPVHRHSGQYTGVSLSTTKTDAAVYEGDGYVALSSAHEDQESYQELSAVEEPVWPRPSTRSHAATKPQPLPWPPSEHHNPSARTPRRHCVCGVAPSDGTADEAEDRNLGPTPPPGYYDV